MTTKEFIEKAIAGGWNKDFAKTWKEADEKWGEETQKFEICVDRQHFGMIKWIFGDDFFYSSVSDLFLDPKAWQAVGKVMGWSQDTLAVCSKCGGQNETTCKCLLDFYLPPLIEEYIFHMHRMIDALAEGKSIEEFLVTL